MKKVSSIAKKEYISLTQGKENTPGEKIIAEKTNRSQEKAKVKKQSGGFLGTLLEVGLPILVLKLTKQFKDGSTKNSG